MAKITLDSLKQEHQDYILEGMAEALWRQAWSQWSQDNGMCAWCGLDIHVSTGEEPQAVNSGEWVLEDGDRECAGSYDGHTPQEISDFDSGVPNAAYRAADALAALIAEAEGLAGEAYPLADLFEVAMTFHAGEFHFESAPDQPIEHATTHDMARAFGELLAMQAMGTGVRWSDAHVVERATRHGRVQFDPRIPHFDVHFDGVDISWEGDGGRGPDERRRRGNPDPGAPAPSVQSTAGVAGVLARRRLRCSGGCRGWDVFDSNEGVQIQACDECNAIASAAGLPTVTDDEVAALPEAQQALQAVVRDSLPSPSTSPAPTRNAPRRPPPEGGWEVGHGVTVTRGKYRGCNGRVVGVGGAFVTVEIFHAPASLRRYEDKRVNVLVEYLDPLEGEYTPNTAYHQHGPWAGWRDGSSLPRYSVSMTIVKGRQRGVRFARTVAAVSADAARAFFQELHTDARVDSVDQVDA